MIQLIDLKDDYSLIINGEEIEIMDANEDFVWATCDLNDLDNVSIKSFPAKLILEVHSEDDFGTQLFSEIIISAGSHETNLDFVCSIPNKFWEGFYGLATFIDAIHEQARKSKNFEVVDSETEDVFKRIMLRRHVTGEELVLVAISETASELKMLERAAEVALARKAVRLFKK